MRGNSGDTDKLRVAITAARLSAPVWIPASVTGEPPLRARRQCPVGTRAGTSSAQAASAGSGRRSLSIRVYRSGQWRRRSVAPCRAGRGVGPGYRPLTRRNRQPHTTSDNGRMARLASYAPSPPTVSTRVRPSGRVSPRIFPAKFGNQRPPRIACSSLSRRFRVSVSPPFSGGTHATTPLRIIGILCRTD